MTSTSDSPTLDREFLPIRAKILEIAAALDRIERTDGLPAGDDRMKQIAQSIELLGGPDSNRARAVQMIFSLPYNESWRNDFGV